MPADNEPVFATITTTPTRVSPDDAPGWMALDAYAKLVTSARRAKRRTANRVSADDILDAIVGGVPGSQRHEGLIDFGSGAIRSRRLPMCDGGAFEYTICVLGAPAGRSRRRGGGAGPQYPRDPWDRLKLEPEVPAALRRRGRARRSRRAVVTTMMSPARTHPRLPLRATTRTRWASTTRWLRSRTNWSRQRKWTLMTATRRLMSRSSAVAV